MSQILHPKSGRLLMSTFIMLEQVFISKPFVKAMLFIRVVVVCCLMLMVSAEVFAANVSNKTYNKLEKARVLLDEGKEREVITLLEEYMPSIENRTEDYALVLRFIIPTLVRLGEEGRALQKLETAYEKKEVRESLGQVYGSLLIMQERYAEADKVLGDWLNNTESPPGDAYYTRAYARFQLEKYPLAEQDLLKAIEIRENAPNNWYEMLVACYFFQEKFTPAETLIKTLIEDDPEDVKKWRLLSKIYIGQNNYQLALATLMNAKVSKLLDEKDDNQIIGLHAYLGIPEKSARLLQQKLDDKTLEANFENYSRLAQYWLMAKERKEAKLAYAKAADMDSTGGSYYLLANLYFEDAQWSEAEDAYEAALKRGKIKDKENVILLSAITALRMKKFAESEDLLNSLIKREEKNAGAARYWLTQVEKIRGKTINN